MSIYSIIKRLNLLLGQLSQWFCEAQPNSRPPGYMTSGVDVDRGVLWAKERIEPTVPPVFHKAHGIVSICYCRL